MDNTPDILKDRTPEEQQMLLELAEQLLKVTQHNSKKVTKATDKEWDEIKKSDHIVTIDKELKAKTKTTKTMEDLERLIESSKTKKHLTGTIIGVRSIDVDDFDTDGSKAKALEEAKKKGKASKEDEFATPEKSIKTWVAEVQFGNDTCTILIPSYQLYPYRTLVNRTLDSEEIVHLRMMDMIGAEIEFVVRHVNKGKKLAFASRLQALDDNGWGNYIRQTRSGTPRITVGSVAEAKVVAVRAHAIVVDVGGAETVLQATKEINNLSWDFIADCRKVFKVNDIIPVKILDIITVKHKVFNETYNMVTIKSSHKATMPNPMEEYWDTIHEGEIGLATVTRITEARCFCKYKNRVDILCKAPTVGPSTFVGDTRMVQISIKKDEPGEGKRIFGIFV